MADISARLRIRRNAIRATKLAKRLLGLERTVYVDQRVAEYLGYWSSAAALLGADLSEITAGCWEVRLGERRTRIWNYITEIDDPVTLALAGDKAYCLEIARNVGVPVPSIGRYGLEQWSTLLADFRRHSGGSAAFVVKPNAGSSSGIGITTGIRTARELERATLVASLIDDSFLLERMVPLESCRLLYLDGEMIHAVRRKGVRVTGDGRSTVAQLLHGNRLGHLVRDSLTSATLDASNLDVGAVPADGVSVVVRPLPSRESRKEELRTVYDETITDQVGTALRDEVARVVHALRGRFVGVDILTNDPGCSLRESGGVFLELNTTPGIHHHYHTPEEHQRHPVAVRVLERLLQPRPHGSEFADGVGVSAHERRFGENRGS